jgi:hypothetical protein
MGAMSTRLLRPAAVWPLLGLLCAVPAGADVDILTTASCGDVVTNSVTNRIYAKCGFDLVEIDGATHAQRSLPVEGRVVGVDPIQNRVVAWTPISVTIVDVPSWSATVVPLVDSFATSSFSPVALDPVSDSIWVIEAPASRATRIDGATGATTHVALGMTGTRGAIAIDPVGRFAYATIAGPRIVEIDLASLATRDIVLAPPVTSVQIAGIDPVRGKLYAVAGRSDFPPPPPFLGAILRIDRVTGAVDDSDTVLAERTVSIATDPGNDRVWRFLGWFSSVREGTLELFTSDGALLGSSDPCCFFGTLFTASPATGRAYVAYGWKGDGNAGLAGFDAIPLGAPYDIPFPSVFPNLYVAQSPAVMFSTSKVYAAYQDTVGLGFSAIREVDEAESAPIPLPVAITADPAGPDGTLVVHFEASSGFPTPLPIEQIYYQVDSVDDVWTAASAPGASSSATLALPPGPHTIHAFAVDGQESSMSMLHSRNPVTGPVASLDVVQPALACDVEMSQPTYGNGEDVVITSLRFVNHTAAPVEARLRLQLTLPFGITANALDLGAGGGFFVPASFDRELGPVTMFTLQPSQPRGPFQWRCALEDPDTGAVIAEDLAPFTFE